MADLYTFQNLGQLSHTAGQIPFLYDVATDVYRPINDLDLAGSNQHTSKGRLKVSTAETIFFNTFQYGKETDVWDEFTTGGASGIFNPAVNQVDMSVSNISGSEIVRQTRNALRYIPSRNSNLSFAIKLNEPTSGIRRRFGLFDTGDGAFFEDGGDGNYYCVIRNSISGYVSELKVPRNEWNGDKLDGLGPSKIIANPNAQQLINIDYEWYGAGDVSFNYIIDGKPRKIHTFKTANYSNIPWAKTPFLPIRVEMTNTSGGQTGSRYYLNQGSNSVISEGTSETLGIAESILTPIAGTSIPKDNFYPLISIRLKPTELKAIVLPKTFQVGTPENNVNIFFKIIRNATLVGANWQNMPDTNSFAQYDLSATGVINDGVELDNGFVVFGGGSSSVRLDDKTTYQIGRGGIGTYSDTFTLAVGHAGSSNKNVFGAMTWIEQR